VRADATRTWTIPVICRDLCATCFRGPIYADAATVELCNLLLPDSAHLQEEDSDNAARRGSSKHDPPLPLYTQADVEPVLNAFRVIPRADPFTISPQFTVCPHEAGHILGSSSLELTITENGKKTVVLFSGDIGRYDQPILKDPEAPPRCDVLLCESTYGDRDHPAGSEEDALADVINRVAKRGGVIVIPAFAVGRTQTIMYIVRKLENANRIPRLPVYVDSPMAISVTSLYISHREDHDPIFTQECNNGNPLDAHTVHYMRSAEDSKKINDVRTPAIIIQPAAWPPADAYCITSRNARRISETRFCLPAFRPQARAAALSRMARRRFAYLEWMCRSPRKSSICVNFPRYAGKSELMRWLTGLPAPPRQTYLVHGEPAASAALKHTIESDLRWRVTLPTYLQTVDLDS